MADADPQLEMAEVRLRTLVYCGECMHAMQSLSNASFSCPSCGARHTEK